MSRKLKQVISCQSFSPISDVRDGIIVTKDGKFVKLMEFSPCLLYTSDAADE